LIPANKEASLFPDHLSVYFPKKQMPVPRLIISLLLLPCFLCAQETISEEKTTLKAAELYKTYCTNCHGANMEGAQFSPLRKDKWMYGRDKTRMLRTVMYGIPNTDMIPWSQILSEEQCGTLVDFIIESQDRPLTEARPFPKELVTQEYVVKVESLITEGFNSSPWGIEFVNDRRALITERREGLRWMVDGKLDPKPIEGIPVATHYGDSGMFDLALHPDYKNNGWVYISYVHPLGDPDTRETAAMTRVIRGRVDGHRWIDQEDIFRVSDELHISPGRGPWGSRLLFHSDGHLYFSIGDSTTLDAIQVLDKPSGKSYRVLPDGSIPSDNPYVGKPGAIEAIFSIGNRNIQGMAEHPLTGAIWATEHGPMGGDELNILEKGKNYGWPVISHGKHYTGEAVSVSPFKEGMEQPVKYWVPSPALCPLEFYTGDLFPKWKNQAFIGALAFEEVKRLTLGKNRVISEEIFLKSFGRVRDIKTGPEGALYLVLNNPHAVLRLTPADS
jgi:glucose/arabinose dehydrogenase